MHEEVNEEERGKIVYERSKGGILRQDKSRGERNSEAVCENSEHGGCVAGKGVGREQKLSWLSRGCQKAKKALRDNGEKIKTPQQPGSI